MTDADRTLLVAAWLSAAAATLWARHIRGLDPNEPARRVAELHTANGLAILTAALGGAALGLGGTRLAPAVSAASVAFGLGFVLLGGMLLRLEPREALQDRLIALNPGWLAHEAALAPDGDADLEDEELVELQP